MKNIIAKLVVVGIAMFGVPVLAQADDLLTKDQMERRIEMKRQRAETLKRMKEYRKQMGADGNLRKKGHTKVMTVPELDPNTAGSAFALLAGSVVVVAGRRRKLVA